MGYRITISWEAEDQLNALPVREQRILEAAVLARLRDHPAQPTRAIKRLRPNPLAEFELSSEEYSFLRTSATTQVSWP
jgi:hypothetical protein